MGFYRIIRETSILVKFAFLIPIASNSHLAWSPVGNKLFFSVGDNEWMKKCGDLFEYATKGPLIIHDSEKPG
jgi:hypothetical protein